MRAPALLLLVLFGCTARERVEPVHTAVVCLAEGEGTCPSAERAAAFDRWAHEGMRRAGSTFTTWIGDGGVSPRAVFTACVPEGWGPGVMEAKAAFLREGRRRASVGGEPLPGGCAATTELVGNVEVLGEGRRWQPVTAAEPLHFAVVCDRSDSMLGLTCDEVTIQAAFDSWLARSGGTPGSAFEVFGVGTSRDGAERVAHVSAESVPAGERLALLLAARARIAAGLNGAAPTGSAIAEAVSVAAATLRSGTGARELVILSDLRQVTPGVWNFEVAVPSPEVFAGWLRATGLSSDLRGVEVRACGLHHRRAPGAPPFDAGLARRVETAWKGAFALMEARGAQLDGNCAGGPSARPARRLAAR
jgi:hypothetical protein